MWKALIFVVVLVLAVPIFGGIAERETTASERYMENMLKEKCKNVSGSDVDYHGVRLEFANCSENAFNIRQIRGDYSVLLYVLTHDSTINSTHQQKASGLAFLLKYCPSFYKLVECDLINAPFYRDCYTVEERATRTLIEETMVHALDFFCTNKSESVASFIDAKVPECVTKNEVALTACLQEYSKVFEGNQIFGGMPNADEVCNYFETLRQCVVPLIEQCESSPTAATIVKSFFTDIQSRSSCSDLTLMRSRL